jgi:DNA-binding transcriptional regulator PaaX
MGSCVNTPVLDREMLMSAAKRSIVRAASQPIDPAILIQTVSSEGIDEYFVRAAIWSLLDRGQIRETEQRQLVSRA